MKLHNTALLIGMMGLGMAACGKSGGLEAEAAAAPAADGAAAQVRQVSVVALAPEAFKSHIQAAGTALPVREGYLSAAVPGRIQEILVARGDKVTKGQPLVRLDRSGFYLGVQQAEAGLAAAKVGVDALSTEMKRFDRLLANKAVPKASYDKVKAQYDGAMAQVAMAEVGLKQARKALSDAELRAPYDGVITMVMKEIGEYAPAMPPTMLIQIVDTSSLQVQVFLPETVARSVEEGMQAEVEIDSAKLTRTGEVIFVSDRIQPGSQTFEVRIKLDNADGAIKAGAFARVKLVRRDEAKALLVPLRAVLREQGKTFVFVAKDGKAVKVPVKLGETQADRVLVLEGLAPGDEAITSGASELDPGQAVLPARS